MTATPLQFVHKLEQVQGWIDQGNFDCAICEMAILPKGAKECPEAYHLRAQILWWLGEDQQAMDTLTDAFQKWPMVPRTSLRLAGEVADLGLDDSAYAFLRRNYPEPIDEWLLRYIIATYCAPNHPWKALKHLRISHETAPDKNFLSELAQTRPELARILRIIREGKNDSTELCNTTI